MEGLALRPQGKPYARQRTWFSMGLRLFQAQHVARGTVRDCSGLHHGVSISFGHAAPGGLQKCSHVIQIIRLRSARQIRLQVTDGRAGLSMLE